MEEDGDSPSHQSIVIADQEETQTCERCHSCEKETTFEYCHFDVYRVGKEFPLTSHYVIPGTALFSSAKLHQDDGRKKGLEGS